LSRGRRVSLRRYSTFSALTLTLVLFAVASLSAPSIAAHHPSAKSLPLRGRVIVIDPGHNGANGAHPSVINRLVFIVNRYKACDTTGTQTNSGYTESAFNFDVAMRLAALLRKDGATVVLARKNNSGVGPCINERAAIGNQAHAAAAISIHGDGGPASGFGFHVIAPANVGPNAAIVAPSHRLAVIVRNDFRTATGEPYATYVAHLGLITRSDLGGLNLSKVPKVFIECGNMRNPSDARRMMSTLWRQRAAVGLEQAFLGYLRVT